MISCDFEENNKEDRNAAAEELKNRFKKVAQSEFFKKSRIFFFVFFVSLYPYE